jgi:hypothetical protein
LIGLYVTQLFVKALETQTANVTIVAEENGYKSDGER